MPLGYRRGQVVPLKRNADKAIEGCPTIEHVLVVMRRRSGVGDEMFAEMKDGRDHWWHRLKREMPKECAPEPMGAEDLLFILYTSGTTGTSKGVVLTGERAALAGSEDLYYRYERHLQRLESEIGSLVGVEIGRAHV